MQRSSRCGTRRTTTSIFALGGDGTVMEVAAAMAGSGTPIGVLAAGTGNLLARALGIPLSVKRAVPALRGRRANSDRSWSVRVGPAVRDRRRRRDRREQWSPKHRRGSSVAWACLAYTLMGARAAVRAVLRHDFFDARVTIDGTVYERRAAAVMVANFGAVLGKRITLGPGIRTDDGLLDGCIFSPATLRDAVRIMWCMLRADFRADPCIFYRTGRSIQRGDHALPCRGRRTEISWESHRLPWWSNHSPFACWFHAGRTARPCPPSRETLAEGDRPALSLTDDGDS